jgi:hypothetical protein
VLPKCCRVFSAKQGPPHHDSTSAALVCQPPRIQSDLVAKSFGSSDRPGSHPLGSHGRAINEIAAATKITYPRWRAHFPPPGSISGNATRDDGFTPGYDDLNWPLDYLGSLLDKFQAVNVRVHYISRKEGC